MSLSKSRLVSDDDDDDDDDNDDDDDDDYDNDILKHVNNAFVTFCFRCLKSLTP